MAKFKVGNRVKLKEDSGYISQSGGRPGKIVEVRGEREYRITWDNGHTNSYYDSHITSINSSFMENLKQSFTNIFLKEPEKSFRKAGITGEDGMLTEEGQAVFLAWQLSKNGDAFKTEVVDLILAERKENE